MVSGGSGAWRSRGSREAMPKPVSRTCPSAQFTRILAGLMSLWTRPRWWSLPSAAAMPMARRRKRPISIGAPSSRSSGSPPGSSSTSMVRPSFAHELQRPHRPRAVQFVLQPVFVSEAIEAGGWWMFGGGPHKQARSSLSSPRAPPSAEDALAVLPQDLEAVTHRRRNLM